MAYSWASNKLLRRQLLQQRLRLLQIKRVETLTKPRVNWSQQFARLLHLALVAPEAGEAHGGAERLGGNDAAISERHDLTKGQRGDPKLILSRNEMRPRPTAAAAGLAPQQVWQLGDVGSDALAYLN